MNTLRDILSSMGLSPWQHYESFGAFETRADGTLLNPSNAFDANAYVQAKTAQLNAIDPSTQYSVQDVVGILQQAGYSPMGHALAYGQDESKDTGLGMIQTVPDAQRVAADHGRGTFQFEVPSNSVSPTLGPSAVSTPQTAPNAFDMDAVPLPQPAPVQGNPQPGGYTPPSADDFIVCNLVGNTLFFDINEASSQYETLNPLNYSGMTNIVPSIQLEHKYLGGQNQFSVYYNTMLITNLNSTTERVEKITATRVLDIPEGTVFDMTQMVSDLSGLLQGYNSSITNFSTGFHAYSVRLITPAVEAVLGPGSMTGYIEGGGFLTYQSDYNVQILRGHEYVEASTPPIPIGLAGVSAVEGGMISGE